MKFLKYIIILISLITLVGCSPSHKNSDPAKKVLKVGTSADYPPFEYFHHGKIIGFDIDVIKAISKELDYEVEIYDMDFNALLTALKVGQIDCIIASLSPTEERKKNVDFSVDYFDPEPMSILSRKSDPITSLESLKGKIVGAQMGSSMEILANKLAPEYGIEKVESLSKNNILVEELKLGRIHAVIVGKSQGAKFAEMNSRLIHTSIPVKGEACAIAFKKESPLKEPFDKILTELKENGTLKDIAKKWGLY